MFSPVIDSYTYISRSHTNDYFKKGKVNTSSGHFEEITPTKEPYEYYQYVYSFGYTLNGVSKSPWIGVVLGPGRSALGLLDIITGIALGIFSKSEYFHVARIGLENALRGAIETIMGAASIIAITSDAVTVIDVTMPRSTFLAIYILGAITLKIYDDIWNQTDPKKKLVYEK